MGEVGLVEKRWLVRGGTSQELNHVTMAQSDSNVPLKQLVLENVSKDDDGIHCKLTSAEPQCTYVQQNFNHKNFARHFCHMHPFEASMKGFCRGFLEGVLERGVQKASEKDAIVGKIHVHIPMAQPRPNLSLKQLVMKYISIDDEVIHCELAGNGPKCTYVQHDFNHKSFAVHFCQMHPFEAGKKGFGRGYLKEVLEKAAVAKASLKINVAAKTPYKDPSKYCRLCFSTTGNLQPVFNRRDSNDLAALVESCTHVQLDPDEDLRSLICVGCCQKLHEIQRFQRQCQRLNEIVVNGRKGAKRTKRPAIEAAMDDDESATFLVEMIKPEPMEYIAEETSIVLERPPAEEDTVEELPYSVLSDGSFRCQMCERTLNSLASMITHFQNDHEQATSPVPSGSTDESERDESFGRVVVNEVPYYKCTDCDTLMRLKSKILRHWRRYHRDRDRQEDIVFCTESGCDQFFMESKALKKHLELFHGIRLVDSNVND